jgi:hypothetical protein
MDSKLIIIVFDLRVLLIINTRRARHRRSLILLALFVHQHHLQIPSLFLQTLRFSQRHLYHCSISQSLQHHHIPIVISTFIIGSFHRMRKPIILSNITVFLSWLLTLTGQNPSADAFNAARTATGTAAPFGRIIFHPLAAADGTSTQLQASIGLGPDKRLEKEGEGRGSDGTVVATAEEEDKNEKREWVAGVDYEIPDHESYRTSRRSKLDEQCDRWFGALLGGEDDVGVLGPLAEEARRVLLTPVPLVNDVRRVLSFCFGCIKYILCAVLFCFLVETLRIYGWFLSTTAVAAGDRHCRAFTLFSPGFSWSCC